MPFTFTMLDADTGATANVLVDAEPTERVRTVVAEAERLIAADLSAAGRRPVYYLGSVPIDLDQTLDAAGLRDGTVVARALAAAPPAPLRAPAPVEIRVTSGPHAGQILRAGYGIMTIGSGPDATLRIDADPTEVPAVALIVTIGPDRVTIEPVVDGVDVDLDGEPVHTATEWRASAQLRIGPNLLTLIHPTERGAHLTLSDDGMHLEYNRPPRILPPEDDTRYALPVPPPEPPARTLPILMALAPMGMAVMFVSTTGRWAYLLVALLSPILMIITGMQGNRRGKKAYRRRVAEYDETKARIEADARDSLQTERARWIAGAPDPAEVYETAVVPQPRLWERRRTDPDHLLVRVGTATQESSVTLDDPEQLSHKRSVRWLAHDVPVRIRLAERGVVGFAAAGDEARRLAAWSVAQLATLQSPKDVSFVLLTDSSRAAIWEWMSWLPHVRRDGPDQPSTSIAATAAATARSIAELCAIIDARTEAGVGTATGAQASEQIVVVMDGARRLRAMPSLVRVLKEGPAVGIFSICLDLGERLLPEECDAVVVLRDGRLRVRQQRTDLIDARPDLVDADWLEWVARSLAPIVDASPDVQDGAIPASARLLEVLNLPEPSADTIRARWLLGGRTTSAVIGASIDGAFAIDLREDGPHGLMAGTTGSGKSELLQTIVAALAVANRPDAMQFVLVDYKGGAAFKDCAALPHTVGMVTDLDTHQVERALASLGAELRTREHMLAAVDAKDIEDYQDILAKRAAGGDAAMPALGRLVIIIDEFASLARELPDFVTGLVNIAQRGRSLGIHLILATQRPGGVVSPEIRANTNLRIALRVTDQSESQDVIGANDAARIAKSTPGRAYVRLGAASLLPFQTARVGGRYRNDEARHAQEPLIREQTFASLSEPPPRRSVAPGATDDVEITDLTVLVTAVQGASNVLGLADQRKPWLPPLPPVLTLADLEAADTAAGGPLAVAWGLEDHPALQVQRPTLFDLDADGHLFVIGAPRSGRSQALRTLAAALAGSLGPDDVHLYAIDCGNGALLPLNALPHCGAVVQRHEAERASRLLATLLRTVRDRQALFAAHGYSSIAEQRDAAVHEAAQPLPHIVLMIDQWEGFTSALADVDNGALGDTLQILLREGVSVGVHIIITGDRTLTAGRMSSQVERKLLLALADRGDYTYEGINGKKLPDTIPPGRGFRSGTATETQIAVLPAGTTGRDQAAALQSLGAELQHRVAPDAPRPFRVDALPTRLSLTQAAAYRRAGAAAGVGLGVGGDELVFWTHDFVHDTAGFVVAGSPGSGKSTALAAMALDALNGGCGVVAVTPRGSVLRQALDARVQRDQDAAARVHRFTGTDLDADALRAAIAAVDGFVLVLVDDAEHLKDTAAEPVLRGIMESEPGRSAGLVIAGDVEGIATGFRGWQVDLKKMRRGMLLAPRSTVDGDLIGAKLPRSMIGGDGALGRALLHEADQTLRVVQVPLPE